MMPTAIVAYLALFATVGFLFILASLLLGRLVRACAPSAAKLATYECGEPAVGPGSVQFDLRFYVVALVFLIFEVEVALFFPPATIFGQANQLRADKAAQSQAATADSEVISDAKGDSPIFAETKIGTVPQKSVMSPFSAAFSAGALALAAMLDLALFFAVLLVGFAYVWRRGDLDWVRAVRHPNDENHYKIAGE
jgi:NADH-quinone oxidoreductase subunit A